MLDDPSASFGIQTDADDVETVLGYYVDGEFVDARDVQHRRANVDFNVKRGLPLYAPVRKNLRRAEKLLRNMSVVAEIQSAIALIRKHRGASRSGIEQFVANDADASTTSGTTGRTRHYSQYGPGTILDAPAGLEYDFPARGSRRLELRHRAAGRAAGDRRPARDARVHVHVRRVERELRLDDGGRGPGGENVRAAAGEHDRTGPGRDVARGGQRDRRRHVCRRTLHDVVHIQIMPPSLHVRDQLQQAQVDRIAFNHGVLSPQTWSQHLGLDYDQEQKNLAVHTARNE